MLAYYVEFHMRSRLAPLLFDDHDRAAAAAERTSIVAPAQPSPAAKRKAALRRTDDGLPVHSFRSLINDLATLCLNKVSLPSNQSTASICRPSQRPSRLAPSNCSASGLECSQYATTISPALSSRTNSFSVPQMKSSD